MVQTVLRHRRRGGKLHQASLPPVNPEAIFGLGAFNRGGTANFTSTPNTSEEDFSNGIFRWVDIEPTQANYDPNTLIENILAGADGLGKTSIIRVLPNAGGTGFPWGQMSPQYIFDLGCAMWGTQNKPVPYDSIYRTHYGNFIDWFGANFNGDSRLQAIQVPVGGSFGEMTNAGNNPPGYTASIWYETIEWHLNRYRQAFPDTPLIFMVNSTMGVTLDSQIVDAAVDDYGCWIETNSPDGANGDTRNMVTRRQDGTYIIIESENQAQQTTMATGFDTMCDTLFAWITPDAILFHNASFADATTLAAMQVEARDRLRVGGP